METKESLRIDARPGRSLAVTCVEVKEQIDQHIGATEDSSLLMEHLKKAAQELTPF
jgi:hypothetical protein